MLAVSLILFSEESGKCEQQKTAPAANKVCDMNFKPGSKLNLLIMCIVFSMVAACTSSPERQGSLDSESLEAVSSTQAMVDSVTVEQRNSHYYAVINGFYPDACTYISTIVQSVESNTISITLLTDRPADLLCVEMLTPFTIDVLLTTGGLKPQEYTVIVNKGPSATFLLE